LAESLSVAFLLLLERLGPSERAAFLLREVFDFGYGEIAAILDKSEANCRQMVSRAHARLGGRPRYAVSAEAQLAVVERFAQACATGDLPGLLSVLADDAVAIADSGGQTAAARRPVHGADRVARLLLGLLKKSPPGYTIRSGVSNGQPAFFGYIDGQPYHVLILEIAGDRVQAVYNVLNPEKLTRLPPSSANP
jgi:RNA polymerase sigma-70 factor (ECF subfamily)